MNEEKKEQKIDLKDRMLSDDDLSQVSGGYRAGPCPVCGGMFKDEPGMNRGRCTACTYSYGY